MTLRLRRIATADAISSRRHLLLPCRWDGHRTEVFFVLVVHEPGIQLCGRWAWFLSTTSGVRCDLQG